MLNTNNAAVLIKEPPRFILKSKQRNNVITGVIKTAHKKITAKGLFIMINLSY